MRESISGEKAKNKLSSLFKNCLFKIQVLCYNVDENTKKKIPKLEQRILIILFVTIYLSLQYSVDLILTTTFKIFSVFQYPI